MGVFLVVFQSLQELRGGHLYLWATPLLAPVFNRGKTAPGGGRGSRSPPAWPLPTGLHHISYLH